MNFSKLLLIGILLAVSNLVYAGGRITGRVIDKNQNIAVEYASVTLHSPSDSSLVTGVVTNSNGSFALENVKDGTYLLRVSFIGYATYFYPKQIVISPNHRTVNTGKLLIAPSATTLEATEIVAERTMVEYQLDKRVINVDKNIVTGGGTATDVLENVPSVTVDNDGNVSLRGSSNVKVLIDGRPYELMGNDLGTLLEQIPASTIENVEVITNPSAKYDPEGMSGIINLKLKDRTTAALGLNGVVNLNVGTPLAFLFSDYPDEHLPALIPTTMGSVNLNYSTEKYNIFFSADAGRRSRGNMGHSDIERMRDGNTWSHDVIDQYSRNTNYMGSVKLGAEYYFNDKNSLLFSYQLRGGMRNRQNQIFSNDVFTDGFLDYAQTDSNSNRNVSNTFNLSYAKKFDEKDRLFTADATFSMRHRVGNGVQEQDYYDENAQWGHYYLRESFTENVHPGLNLKLNYVHPFGPGWKFETGYEGRMDWPDQNAEYYRSEFPSVGSEMITYFDSVSSTHFDYMQQVHAAYATIGGTIVEGLTAQAGLRLEYADMWGYDVNHPATDSVVKNYWKLYPTMHISYEIDKSQSIQLSYSRRVRRPHMWNLNPYLDVEEGQELSFGNPNLDPEFTNAIELSYNLGVKNVNIFSSAYFRQTNNMMTRYGFVWDENTHSHYSPWMPYNSQYDGYWASTWQNLNTGLNYGLEFIIDWQILKWWKVNVSVNLYQSMIEGTELLDNKDEQAFLASGKFSSYMNLPKDWTVQLSGQYRAPFLDLQTQMLSSYWVDLAVKKDVLQKRGTINLRVGDALRTNSWGHITHTDQLNRTVHGKRLSPYVTIGFSYKINNGLKTNRRNAMDLDIEGEDGEF